MTAVWLGRGSIAHAAVKIQCSLTNFLINNQILSYPRISGYPKHSILYPKGVISYDRIASLAAMLQKVNRSNLEERYVIDTLTDEHLFTVSQTFLNTDAVKKHIFTCQ